MQFCGDFDDSRDMRGELFGLLIGFSPLSGGCNKSATSQHYLRGSASTDSMARLMATFPLTLPTSYINGNNRCRAISQDRGAELQSRVV